MSARAREFHEMYATLLISNQLSYYRNRASEYQKAHGEAVIVRNLLLLGAATAGAIGQFSNGTPRAAVAIVAAAFAALAGAVTAYEALIGFPQLGKLYSDAARNLEEAAIDWQVADSGTDLSAEVERVEAIFRSEVGQWGQLVVKAVATAGSPGSDGRNSTT